MGLDEIQCGYVLEDDWSMVLNESHNSIAGGHYAGKAIMHMIL